MCASAIKGDDTDFGVFLIYEKPVRGDEALTIANVIAVQTVVTILLG